MLPLNYHLHTSGGICATLQSARQVSSFAWLGRGNHLYVLPCLVDSNHCSSEYAAEEQVGSLPLYVVVLSIYRLLPVLTCLSQVTIAGGTI